jgi:DNA-binding SARP family transcriptional activator/nucleoside-triphosphatase THEP1
MEPIKIKLFNIPSVIQGSKRIVFPSRKIEGLFYYLVVNKESTREELASLLWPDADAQTGRKNVRNALYYIKKSFDGDIIISPNKSIVLINPKASISSDLEKLFSEDNWIDAYEGDFLKGFVTKDEAALEDWITNTRERYKSIYVQKLYNRIRKDFAHDNYQDAGQCARRLIEIDEYDEKAYRVLMKALAEMNLYNKALDIYDKLSEVLKKDLGIIPDAKSRALYEKIKQKRSLIETQSTRNRGKLFYGRKQELTKLHSNYSGFKNGTDYSSILIIGEAGIGKTALMEKFINDIGQDDSHVLVSNCYQAEEEFPLRPWTDILGRALGIIEEAGIKLPFTWRDILETFFPSFASYAERSETATNIKESLLRLKMLEETIISLLEKVSKIKKTIVVFDDIQWMDNQSISLLSGLLLHLTKDVLVIAACRNSYSQRVENFIAEMVRHNRLDKIELNRFTKEEVTDFARKSLPDYDLEEGSLSNALTRLALPLI